MMNTKIIFPDKWNNANPDKSTIEEMYLPNRMKLLGFSNAAIKNVENFMFSKNEKDADIESGAIVNVILEEFYDNETPVLERYYKLLMILDDDFLCAEDIAGIEEEILKIRKLAELECYVESEAYLTEDEKKIDDVQSALKYATLYLKFDKYYIIKKTNGAGETECKFWYNKNLDLVGYDLMVNSF